VPTFLSCFRIRRPEKPGNAGVIAAESSPCALQLRNPGVDDVRVSARKGVLRIYGKGERVREIPIHPQLRTAVTGWLDERPGWPGAQATPTPKPERSRPT